LGASACAMFTRKLQSREKIPPGLTLLEDVSQLSPLVQRILGLAFEFLESRLILNTFRAKSRRFYFARDKHLFGWQWNKVFKNL